MRSRSSAPVKAGRSIPFSFIASAIWGPWFHSAAATRTGEAKTFIASSDGPDAAARAPDLVADRALLRREELAPVLAVARRVEVVERVQEGDEVPRLLRVERGPVDAELFHPLDIFGRWFHIAVARSKNERGRDARARSGPIFPPTPLMA